MFRLLSVEAVVSDSGSTMAGTGVWPAPDTSEDWLEFFQAFSVVLCGGLPDLVRTPERYTVEILLTVFKGQEDVLRQAYRKSASLGLRDPRRLAWEVGPVQRLRLGGNPSNG